MRGLFISIDGPSGVGKTTVLRLVVERLRGMGRHIHATREPGDGGLGQLARASVETIEGAPLACLFAAARYDQLVTETRPRIAAGEIVVQDRYLASSLVMQRMDGVSTDFLWNLNTYADIPDLSVVLTADPKTIALRLTARGPHNRYQNTPGSSRRERDYFADAAKLLEHNGFRVAVIDTSCLPPTMVADMICARLPIATPQNS